MQTFDQEGVVQAHVRGFGFVVTENGDKFFMAPPLLRKLLPNDRVGVTVVPGRDEGTWQVGQAWLLERKAGSWLGVLAKTKTGWELETDDPCFVHIRVAPDSTYVAQDVVRVTTSSEQARTAAPLSCDSLAWQVEGAVVECLGSRARAGFEQDYALAKYRFTAEFDEALSNECEQLASEAAMSGHPVGLREDLRALPFVTVDSASTQDFDDALYAEKTAHGWRVLVAIADVSHYVKTGSALDACAKERGTSVYLPGKTVPMLPKALSAGLCALRANTPRYAVVMEMTLNAQAHVTATRAVRAVIQVVENMTYDKVRDMLDSSGLEPTPVGTCLFELQALYAKLKAEAPCELTPGPESAEPTWKPDGPVTKIEWVSRHEAHKIVECFMLLANQQVAKHLAQNKSTPFFRHQGQPTQVKWDSLAQWALTQGQVLPETPSRAAIGNFALSLLPEAHLPGQLHIRSAMAAAAYDGEDPSHFSLGYEAYTHFTSPIRRYADLVVHRLLMGEELSLPDLAELAQHCSLRSRAAKFAERHVWDKLKKRTLVAETLAGARLMGFVVSQSRFGLRAVVLPWQCVVNIAASDLVNQHFVFDSDNFSWVSKNTREALVRGAYLLTDTFELEDFRAKTEVKARLTSVVGLLSYASFDERQIELAQG